MSVFHIVSFSTVIVDRQNRAQGHSQRGQRKERRKAGDREGRRSFLLRKGAAPANFTGLILLALWAGKSLHPLCH